MKRTIISFLAVAMAFGAFADDSFIRIETDDTDLILEAKDATLYQSYYGPKVSNPQEIVSETPRTENFCVYPSAGYEGYYEPAFAITHNDGNQSSQLFYRSHEVRDVPGGKETVITLGDNVYPVTVKLHYIAYPRENVIKAWSEISHSEKKPVTISSYASTKLNFRAPAYYLTEFSGSWANEVNRSTQQLQFGKKILDTTLGTRAAMFCYPFFELGIGGEPQENEGTVLLGTIGWTGNYRFTFDVDHNGSLAVIPSINPYQSNYSLKPGEVFRTPEFIFTLSDKGTGQASRNMHRWARNHSLRNGTGDRYTLLNNWENTYFDFDEAKLGNLMKEAAKLGVDMFLLDDGWFGNKYPRKNDTAGLGDWEPTKSKLPNGISELTRLAKEAGVEFGLWIEPEMVNPSSELFEKHPEWANVMPNRGWRTARSQFTLDLCNPEVQDYVFGVVDRLLTENPDIKYFKWDCNASMTNHYSPYLKGNQNRMYIDHVRGLYNVLDRVREKYPDVDMMLCSGGGGRCDYEALKYFTEFWCSDNTDPLDRLYIQWGFSQVFPAKAMAAHVTNMNRNTSVKFRVDVASMCKLGYDLGLSTLSDNEIQFCKEATANWKRLKPVILDGDQYRLVSPYDGNHMAVSYVGDHADRALLFAYDLKPHNGEPLLPVKLQGLDKSRNYTVREINLMPGRKSDLSHDGKSYSGEYLMTMGLNVFTHDKARSRVIELTAE